MTSSLDIGNILETIRDEARVSVPHAREACLQMFDPEALNTFVIVGGKDSSKAPIGKEPIVGLTKRAYLRTFR